MVQVSCVVVIGMKLEGKLHSNQSQKRKGRSTSPLIRLGLGSRF
jgi:hypothetical protein